MTPSWFGIYKVPWVLGLLVLGISQTGTAQPSVDSLFLQQRNHIPGEPLNQGVKTIALAINIWQHDDGSGNFEDVQETYDRFYILEAWLNDLFSNNRPASHAVQGARYVPDSHIRFDIARILFWRNSRLFEADCASGARLNTHVFDSHPESRQYLNIHLSGGACRGASGYANLPSTTQMDYDSWIVTFIKPHFLDNPDSHWALMLHLAHEIGHVLGLLHPYDSEYCRFSHPDFLFDLFGQAPVADCQALSHCDICYHQGGWSCDPFAADARCTNNLMGGSFQAAHLTALQMGRMNRTLMLGSARKYAYGYVDQAYLIRYDQSWSLNIKFYQDILIESGKTLRITGRLEMPPQARIIIQPGAQLVVDGGYITSTLHQEHWEGILVMPAARNSFWPFGRKRFQDGRIVLLHDGRID